jgi:hypothetical protein
MQVIISQRLLLRALDEKALMAEASFLDLKELLQGC